MEAIHKGNYIKPIAPRVADLGIMLECLHEVYESEESLLQSGKSLRSTMAYPFIKMIETQCQGLTAKEIHRLLWNIYLEGKESPVFVKTAKEQLAKQGKGVGI